MTQHITSAAALPDDAAAFSSATEPFRRELRIHCYRMLGSFQDSEDLVQETLLRAWRNRSTFQGRSSIRTWLYRIATNACLDALQRRPPRVLPQDIAPPADPTVIPDIPGQEIAWLEPFPDRYLEADAGAGLTPRSSRKKRSSWPSSRRSSTCRRVSVQRWCSAMCSAGRHPTRPTCSRSTCRR